MDSLNAKFNYYSSQVDKELSTYPQIVKLQQTTGIKKNHLAAGVVGSLFILIFFDFWGAFFSNLIGWLYPAYASYKAIESDAKTDDTQWLTYWLFLPTFKGAQILYTKTIRPILLSYEDDIDKSINKMATKTKSLVKETVSSKIESSFS